MRKGQSKIASFIEAFSGTATGFVISVLAWKFVVAPVVVFFDADIGLWSVSIWITIFFTFVSIIRVYIIRRISEHLLAVGAKEQFQAIRERFSKFISQLRTK